MPGKPDWTRIQSLFEEAAQLDRPDRAAYLDANCGDQEERAIVERMLESDSAPPRVFAAGPEQLATLMPEGEAGYPETVGPYVIEGVIGRGGMGAVFAAQRPDLPRKVALKLMHGRWLGSEQQIRFRREQAVLARLQHRHIARLLDAGVSDDGTPFLTMDLVDGESITGYCTSRSLSVDDRLGLFINVCDAVRYAHQSLVVHRDLKPSNILVTDDGQVKLLDFGISKLLEDDDGEAPATSGRMMTPSYASPEQLADEPVGTTSDVYSLGVVLHELLVGRRPFDLDGTSSTEAASILTEEAPVPPSTTVDDGALRRRLAGDLDNILLKCLQRSPADRYASVDALSLDLQRHLDGLPVEAHEASLRYRFKKFVMRHRAGSVAASAGLVLTIGFVVALVSEQAATERARERAESAAERAERTSQFLMGLFEASDPTVALGDTVTAVQLLERGIRQAEGLSDQPVLQAETYHTIGQVFQSLGDYPRSKELLERASELWRAAGPSAALDLAATLRDLSAVYAHELDYESSIASAGEALEIASDPDVGNGEDVALGLNSLGLARQSESRYETADSLFALAHERLVRFRGMEDGSSIGILSNRVSALLNLNDFSTADSLARQVVEWRRANLAPNHPDLAIGLDQWAVSLRNLGRHSEAAPLYEEALVIKTAVYGLDHPSTAVSTLNLAILYGSQGQYDRSEPYFLDAVARYKGAFGTTSPRTAGAMSAYSVLLSRVGRFDEAITLKREAFEIQRDKLGPEHANTVATQQDIGVALAEAEFYDEALPVLQKSTQLHAKIYGTESPRYGDAVSVLGLYEAKAGRHQSGVRHAREGWEVVVAALGHDNRKAAHRLGFLGRAMLEAGDFAGADTILAQAHEEFTRFVAFDHPSVVMIVDAMGQTQTRLGRYQEADSLLRAVYSVSLGRLGPEHRLTRAHAAHIAELYEAWGKPEPDWLDH